MVTYTKFFNYCNNKYICFNQDEDTRALENLETFMNEFFSPGTSNERKRIINGIFQEFSSQIDSWRPCLHFLSTTKIDYVSMFALSTLEVTLYFVQTHLTLKL